MQFIIWLTVGFSLLVPKDDALAAPASPGDAVSLDNSAWLLSGLPGHTLSPDRPVTMFLANSQVRGSDGCNSYSAPYTMTSQAFRITDTIESTMRACPDAVMKRANAFLSALAGTRKMRLDRDLLSLLDEGERVLAVFSRQALNLSGTSWQVLSYSNGKQAVVSVLTGSTLTMTFGDDGKLSGSGGCNRYTAPYAISGQKVTIGNAAATRKACADPDGVMGQENAFLAAISKASAVQFNGDRLELRSVDNALMVIAVRILKSSEPAGTK